MATQDIADTECIAKGCTHPTNSPVPVQFDWDKIRTEMKPIKMGRAKA